MSKPVKDMVSRYLRGRYDGVSSACVVDLTGMNVAATEHVRGELRKQDARMEVVKNSLARRAFADTPLAPLAESLRGPCALVITGEDLLIDVAKTLVKLAREYKQFGLKEALYEGEAALVTVEALSRMKTRAELFGEVAGLIWGPGRRVAAAIASPAGRIAGCIKAIADKEE